MELKALQIASNGAQIKKLLIILDYHDCRFGDFLYFKQLLDNEFG